MARSKPSAATEPPSECWEPLTRRPVRDRLLEQLAAQPATVRRLAHEAEMSTAATLAVCGGLVRDGLATPVRGEAEDRIGMLTVLTITLDGLTALRRATTEEGPA